MTRRQIEEAADRKRIGAVLARRMAAAGKRPADLAIAAELDDSQASKVLSGRAGLSLYSLRRVAEALGCTRGEVLAEADALEPRHGKPGRGRAAHRRGERLVHQARPSAHHIPEQLR